MNAESIRQLRIRFIIIAMLSVALVELFITAFLNITNVLTTHNNIHTILDHICENGGDLPLDDISSEHDSSGHTAEEIENNINQGQDFSVFSIFMNSYMSDSSSPEFQYATRYLAVLYDENDEVVEIKRTHIAAFDDDQAVAYSRVAKRREKKYGIMGIYYYEYRKSADGSSIVAILDCRTQVHMMLRLFYSSLIICIGLLLIILWPVYIFSNQLIQPELRNIERQKQFITNASHELKTPLAVIRANTEVLEMIEGENEWTESTMRQVDRMSGLIQNLVQIARAEEQADKSDMNELNFGEIIDDIVKTFRPVAEQDGKTMATEIQGDVTIVADESVIRQLASLLVDNAIKYCDPEGTITVQVSKKGKAARLVVSNNYAAGANTDYSRFFERFYRSDQSHNTEKGGYGIGLSIAESIVRQYRGSISVSWKNGIISFTCIIP